MTGMAAFATKIPSDLKKALDEVCESMGLRKNFVIEMALREKIEDLMDAHDLNDATKEASGFHKWDEVKTKTGIGKRSS